VLDLSLYSTVLYHAGETEKRPEAFAQWTCAPQQGHTATREMLWQCKCSRTLCKQQHTKHHQLSRALTISTCQL